LLETKWTKLAPTEFSNVYFCEEKTRKELLYVSLILSWNWRFITRTAGRQNRPTYAVSWSRIYPSLLSPQNSTRLKHGLSCTGDELLKTDNSCQVYIGPIAWMRTERHAQSRHLNHVLWAHEHVFRKCYMRLPANWRSFLLIVELALCLPLFIPLLHLSSFNLCTFLRRYFFFNLSLFQYHGPNHFETPNAFW
jgi:hypothetical protein